MRWLWWRGGRSWGSYLVRVLVTELVWLRGVSGFLLGFFPSLIVIIIIIIIIVKIVGALHGV